MILISTTFSLIAHLYSRKSRVINCLYNVATQTLHTYAFLQIDLSINIFIIHHPKLYLPFKCNIFVITSLCISYKRSSRPFLTAQFLSAIFSTIFNNLLDSYLLFNAHLNNSNLDHQFHNDQNGFLNNIPSNQFIILLDCNEQLACYYSV